MVNIHIANATNTPRRLTILVGKDNVQTNGEFLGVGTEVKTNEYSTLISSALAPAIEPMNLKMRWNRIHNLIVEGSNFEVTTDEQRSAFLTPAIMGDSPIEWVDKLGAVELPYDYYYIDFPAFTKEEYNAVAERFNDPKYHIQSTYVSKVNDEHKIFFAVQNFDVFLPPYGSWETPEDVNTDNSFFVDRAGRSVPIYIKTDLTLAYRTLLGIGDVSLEAGPKGYSSSPVNFINDFSNECALGPNGNVPHSASFVNFDGVIWMRFFLNVFPKAGFELELWVDGENPFVGFKALGTGAETISLGKFGYATEEAQT